MTIDFSAIDPASIEATVDTALGRAEEIVAGIVDPETPPTFQTVLAPLDHVADLLTRTNAESGFCGYVHPDADTREAAKKAEARIASWASDLWFRDDLYRAVTRFAETDEAARLDGEPARLLRFTLRDLRRAGHELSETDRARVRELTRRLVELGIAFERNIAEHRDHLAVTRDDLDGLPDSYIDGLEEGEDGLLQVTMAYPHVVPFMENARRRDLRERLSRKFNSRAVETNRPILEEAIRLRREIARIFGRPSWAHHQLEERMAANPEAVEAFYEELIPPLTRAAEAEIARMTELLVADGEEPPLQLWDWRYYDTVLRRSEYGVDPHEVASYFPLERVLDGLFDLTGQVFGLRYERVDVPVWHPDVVAYSIIDADTRTHLATFYMDLFPREGKFSHAAAFTLVPGRRLPDGTYQRPVSAIVANFTKPTADRPSLLQHSEVTTLFHEFGHILHQTLTRTELASFSGTNTERDFVEAPSQIMEHWTWRPEVLARFARHHETGEPIPVDLVDRLAAARRLNIGLATLRQIQFGVLDLAIHGPSDQVDLDEVVRRAAAVAVLPFQEGTFFPASFGHLLSGYDAGYYGYLWSEVYGDDMFSRFEAEGIDNPEVGRAYRREILETGGSRDAIEHLRAFLGREPNSRAFLRHLGITPE